MTTTPTVHIQSAGLLSTLQDRGRHGWFSAGVGVSGAADRRSHALANRLVGNRDDAATIESLFGGLEFTVDTPLVVAVTGAQVSVTVDNRPVGHSSVIVLAPHQQFRLGTARTGLRSYVAVRGGFDAQPVLGSRSYDTLSGLGPPPLQNGALVPVGTLKGPSPIIDVAPVAPVTRAALVAHVILGPRCNWFTRPQQLFVGRWTVSDRSDRVGARLLRQGCAAALTRRHDRELPAEGMPLGAIQVAPSGEPVVFLADHPITGGYPVIGTVIDADIDAFAQAEPGRTVIFRSAGRR
jgi:biotin-dependent carboxylase-like uncharacterized protein